MANNQRLVVGIAVVAVVIAVIAIIVLLVSSNSTPSTTVASVASSTAAQNIDTARTQVYGEMTSTAVVLAVTNQAGTIAAMVQTNNAPTATLVPQGQPQIATSIPNTQPQVIFVTPTNQPPTAAPIVVVATSPSVVASQAAQAPQTGSVQTPSTPATAVPNQGAGQLILAPGEGIIVAQRVVGTIWYLPSGDRQSAESYANSLGSDRSKRYGGVFPTNSSWGAVVRLPDAQDNPPPCQVAFSSVALPSQGTYAGDVSCWLVIEWAYSSS